MTNATSPTSPVVPAPSAAHLLFDGPGEMRALCREHRWSESALERVESWPAPLRSTVQMVMAAGMPMLVFWGPDLVQIFNDAFRPSLGEGPVHVQALGASGAQFWAEVWEHRGPQIAAILAGGSAIQHSDVDIPMSRNGKRENVWWTFTDCPVFGENGRIAGVLVICQETTRPVQEELRTQALLAEIDHQRARLEGIMHTAPAFMAVLRGPTHIIELTNARYDALVGGRETRGRAVADALPEAAAQGFVTLLDAVLTTGEPFIGREVPYRRPDSRDVEEDRYIDFVYQAIVESDGSCSGVFVHGVDITAQVMARREIEQLLADSEAERSAAEQANALLQDQAVEMEAQSIELEAQAMEFEAQAEELQGTTAVLEARTLDLQIAAVAAEVARAEAESANRAKSEFLAIMSHELRTPLNAIDGYAELMELGIRGPITPEQRHDLGRIRKSERHLLGLINGVLNYAQIEAGAVHYEFATVRVEEVLATCESLVLPQAGSKGLSVVRGPSDPTLTVRADREKLRQIVLNLLSNAIKFTTVGRIELQALRATASHGDMVAIKVIDTGIGIPASQLHRIFEPFVQVDSEFTRTRDGTGLGLAISRDLARGMGGELTARSMLGAGSAFTLRLPMINSADQSP